MITLGTLVLGEENGFPNAEGYSRTNGKVGEKDASDGWSRQNDLYHFGNWGEKGGLVSSGIDVLCLY